MAKFYILGEKNHSSSYIQYRWQTGTLQGLGLNCQLWSAHVGTANYSEKWFISIGAVIQCYANWIYTHKQSQHPSYLRLKSPTKEVFAPQTSCPSAFLHFEKLLAHTNYTKQQIYYIFIIRILLTIYIPSPTPLFFFREVVKWGHWGSNQYLVQANHFLPKLYLQTLFLLFKTWYP